MNRFNLGGNQIKNSHSKCKSEPHWLHITVNDIYIEGITTHFLTLPSVTC